MSSFKDVVGHKNIIKYIESAVSADAVSHAYILNGERGSGKKLLANLFSMSLQCQNRQEDGDACGKCQSCKQAVSGNHPDIIRVTHEKPNTISVDDIREQVNNDIVIKPYSSKYKIYIIPDADMMSVQAQNALLTESGHRAGRGPPAPDTARSGSGPGSPPASGPAPQRDRPRRFPGVPARSYRQSGRLPADRASQ